MKHKVLTLIVMFLLVASAVYAAVAVLDDGTYEGEATSIDFQDSSVTFDGTKATIDTSTMTSLSTSNLAATGTINLSNSGNNITLLGQSLTVSGTDLFWGGVQLTN
jgi:hypothetical protein